MTLRMVTLGMPPSDPTTFYPPGGIVSSFRRPRHPFGLGAGTSCPSGQIYDYTLQACRPAMAGDDGTVQKVAIGGFALITVLGLVGAGLTTYFVYRVAKKQKWI